MKIKSPFLFHITHFNGPLVKYKHNWHFRSNTVKKNSISWKFYQYSMNLISFSDEWIIYTGVPSLTRKELSNLVHQTLVWLFKRPIITTFYPVNIIKEPYLDFFLSSLMTWKRSSNVFKWLIISRSFNLWSCYNWIEKISSPK